MGLVPHWRAVPQTSIWLVSARPNPLVYQVYASLLHRKIHLCRHSEYWTANACCATSGHSMLNASAFSCCPMMSSPRLISCVPHNLSSTPCCRLRRRIFDLFDLASMVLYCFFACRGLQPASKSLWTRCGPSLEAKIRRLSAVTTHIQHLCSAICRRSLCYSKRICKKLHRVFLQRNGIQVSPYA